MLESIISSGHKGASEAGLIAGFMNDYKTTGFCESGYNDKLKFLGISETSEEVKVIIEKNLSIADGIIHFSSNDMDVIDLQIYQSLLFSGKKIFQVNIDSPKDKRTVINFITDNKIKKLFISGKVDESGKVFKFVKEYMSKVLADVKEEQRFSANRY